MSSPSTMATQPDEASNTLTILNPQDATLTDEPQPLQDPNAPSAAPGAPAALANAPPTPTPYHGYHPGYLPRDLRRKLVNGKWEHASVDNHAKDIYENRKTFYEDKSTVQIVTFFKTKPAKWHDPLQSTNLKAIKSSLQKPEAGTWRWIHCTGLHGPTLQTVANATNWPPHRFAGVFTWTRASVELADERLLMHFINQGTHLYILYAGEEGCPTFITCTNLNPGKDMMQKWEGFVDRGDSRPELILPLDPSLMLYAIVRAVIQDLRSSALRVQRTMGEAYKRAMSRPSQENLAFFYYLQETLLCVKLDVTALKNAAANLNILAKNMQDKPSPLISKQTCERLADQMGLIELCIEELPEICRQADAVGNLAFSTLAFNINYFLKIVAILTIAAVPCSIATGIISTYSPSGAPISRKTVHIIIGCVAGLSLLFLVMLWAYNKFLFKALHRSAERVETDEEEETSIERPYSMEHNLQDLEANNKRIRERTATGAQFLSRPDEYIGPLGMSVMTPRSNQSRPLSWPSPRTVIRKVTGGLLYQPMP